MFKLPPLMLLLGSVLASLATAPVRADVPDADTPPRVANPGEEPDLITLESAAESLGWQWSQQGESIPPPSALAVSKAALDHEAVQDKAVHAWILGDHLSGEAEALIEHISQSWRHGFEPEAYSYSALLKIHRDLKNKHAELDVQLGATIRALADDAFIQLANDLAHGLVDGGRVQERMFHEPLALDAAALLEDIHQGRSNVNDTLERLVPKHEQYARLHDLMTALVGERDWLIKQTDRAADRAARRRYADERRVVTEQIDQVAMAMERWRWMTRDLGPRHVMANLPEFMVYVNDGHDRILEMPVVIGATKHKTPVFSRDISYVEVAPTWTVPTSITRKELWPKFRNNPAWLSERDYSLLEYTDGGYRKVDIDSVDFSSFNSRNFPYTLRQGPGPGNALGRLKIMFPNPYAIYMHDTPAKRYFSHEVRAYSHGCVRLSDPFKMARTLFQMDGYTNSNSERFLRSKETRRRNLRDPLPMHIVYQTGWVDEAGELQTFDDIYGYDDALMKRLRVEHGSLLGTMLSHAELEPLELPEPDAQLAQLDPDL